MLAARDNLLQCISALRAHKLRASLTMLGLTMGVATLITVMTIVQGQTSTSNKRSPISAQTSSDRAHSLRSDRFQHHHQGAEFKKIELEDMRAVAEGCPLAKKLAHRQRKRAREIRQQRGGRRELLRANAEHGGY